MGCANKTVRIVLAAFNSVFMLLSLALLGVGIFVVVSSDRFFRLLLEGVDRIKDGEELASELQRLSEQTGLVKATGYTMIGLGAFVLLISFLGCAGAMLESKCMLATYSVFLGLLAAAKIAGIVLIVVNQSAVANGVKTSLQRLQEKFVSVNEQNPNSIQAAARQIINFLQIWLDCCGAVELDDIAKSKSWIESNRTWIGGDEMKIPVSCCKVKPGEKDTLLRNQDWTKLADVLVDEQCPVTKEEKHTQLCYDSLEKTVKTYLWPTFGSVGGLILLELVLIALSIVIACTARDEKLGRKYD